MMQSFLTPFLTRDGTLRLTTVNFMRANVLKMRSTQALQLLVEAVELFYEGSKDDPFGDAIIHVMCQMTHELDSNTADMKGEVWHANKDDVSDSGDENDKPNPKKQARQLMAQNQSTPAAKNAFMHELELCKQELEHARLWVGMDVHDKHQDEPNRNDNSLNSDHELDNSDDERIEKEEQRAEGLNSHICELESQLATGRRTVAESLETISELEARLLQVGNDALELEPKLQRLREQVHSLEEDERNALNEVEQGRLEALEIRNAIDNNFGDARVLSEDNKKLVARIYDIRDAQERHETTSAEEERVLKEAIADVSHQVEAELYHAPARRKAKEQVLAELSAQFDALQNLDEVARLQNTAAGRHVATHGDVVLYGDVSATSRAEIEFLKLLSAMRDVLGDMAS